MKQKVEELLGYIETSKAPASQAVLQLDKGVQWGPDRKRLAVVRLDGAEVTQ